MAELVDIKDISGNIRFSTTINEGSKRHFLLMQEDYITLLFSLSNPVYFKLGDYVDNELGIFELVDLYKPTYNTTTGAYDYELRLDAYYWKWKNKKFFYTPETTGREAAWNLTATLDTHLNVFLDNLKALGYKFRDLDFTWDIDSTVENTSKLVSYDNVNLIDALTQMAETWECEWWIDNHKICFGRCEYSSPVDFKVGDLSDSENVNVNSMQRSDSQTTYATRIYAFGSTRNIPSTYRKDLIFDVKKVNGGEISDTERVLIGSYFPVSSEIENKVKLTFPENAAYVFENVPVNETNRANVVKKTNIGTLEKGNYEFNIVHIKYSAIMSSGRRFNGLFSLRAWLSYTLDSVEESITLFDEYMFATVNVGQEDVLEIKDKPVKFDLPSRASNCLISTEVGVSYITDTNTAIINFLLKEDDIRYGDSGNSISVTFLSGANVGQTFQSVYNPTFLIGDNANIIRLPEGITASMGDRYTIDNIIKGKVPDSYFSKDDKEMTLNGVVQKRLMFPADIPYVDAYRYSPTGERIDIGDERYDNPDNVEMPEEEAIEEIIILEDEYPQYNGTISSVSHDDKVDDNDKEYRIYNFKDTGLKNFTEDFRLDGEELHMIFQTGKLAGMDFAINIVESDSTGTTFEIVRNEDYGRFLPDDVLYPQTAHMEDGEEVPADTYILYGFDTAYISEQMLPDAEQNLLKKAKEYVKKSMIDPSTYDCEMDADFIYNKGNIRTYEVGAKVNLINKAFFPEGRQSRIIGFEWPLDIPYDHPIYTIGETAAYSRIGEIESKLDSLTYKGQTYSGSAVGGGTSVYVIGVDDKTLPSDKNVFSARRALNEFISKKGDDTATGLITFLKGLISEELIEANNGLVVRKTEVVEPMLMSLLSEEFRDGIVEENEDVFIEEMRTGTGGAATLGELDNVTDEADSVSDTDDILVRLAGTSEWTINTALFSQVSQLMSKVFPFTMTLSGGGTYEKGSSQTINLSWTYDRDIESQSINNESLLIGIRAKQYANVTTDTTYSLKAIQGGQTYTKSVSAQFKVKKYYGVSANGTLTNDEILSLSNTWAGRTQGSTVFDCTGGKYPYYILPTSMVSGIQFWIGGLRNTDWTEEIIDVTNVYGHTESYTLFRLTSIQTGVLNIEVK